jgi:CarD family transcriptional regulator
MARAQAEEILAILKTTEIAVNIQPWNRRFRAYTEMMATGSPSEIAKVLRDMHRLKADKELSFGERRLLEQSKTLLVLELGLALGLAGTETEQFVAEIFGQKP